MNILKNLKKDHRTVSSLFHRLEMTSERAGKTRDRIFREILEELDAHAVAEEEIVYTPMKQDAKAKDQVLEAYEEHSLVKQLLDELAILPTSNERWKAKCSVLQELVEHHVEEEEETLFKLIERRFDKEELEQLGEAFETRKSEYLATGMPGKMARGMSKRA